MESLLLKAKSNTQVLIFLLSLFVITRILLYFAGFLGMNLFPNYQIPPDYTVVQGHDFTSSQLSIQTDISQLKKPSFEDLRKFDSVWYLGIVENGYDTYNINEPHPSANWVFFPLYPLLVFLVESISKYDATVVGSVLSNLFLLVSLFYFYGICLKRGLKQEHAQVAVLLLLVFPTAIFYAVPYTESLFLMLSLMTVYYAMQKRYFLAFLFGGLSAVTRNLGFVNLFFVVGTLLIEHRLYRFKWKDTKYLGYAVISALPLAGYLLYMKWLTGDMLAPITEQSINWYRKTVAPFSNYIHFIQKPYFSGNGGWENGLLAFIIANAVLVIFAVFLIMRWKDIRRNAHEWLFFAYGLLLMLIPFASAEFLQSIPRYVMVAFPFYIYFADVLKNNKALQMFYFMMFFLLHIVYAICYFNGYFFVV
ncbi:mannosyltransferase family protein [Paenibacillus algorifonticola]|uniref:mannosyltransferase family protein n=1 Tax=Paenibacillus algorifonticola TaxID=684063 RepID=UPI003D2B11C7